MNIEIPYQKIHKKVGSKTNQKERESETNITWNKQNFNVKNFISK